MSNLRSIANEYHNAANKIAARAEREQRNLTPNQSNAITYYRISAEKVEALILPEDSEVESVWHLEGQDRQPVTMSSKKVTAADKAATPQELIEKAK